VASAVQPQQSANKNKQSINEVLLLYLKDKGELRLCQQGGRGRGQVVSAVQPQQSAKQSINQCSTTTVSQGQRRTEAVPTRRPR
jgi:hypothetical protein